MYDDYEIEIDDTRNAPPWIERRARDRQHTRTITIPARSGAGSVTVRPPDGYAPTRPGYGYPPPYYYPPRRMDSAKLYRTIGVVVDLVGQAVASFMPLPTAPTLVGQSAVDDENMKRYQESLAKHAKADERIRTIARVIREALDIKAQ